MRTLGIILESVELRESGMDRSSEKVAANLKEIAALLKTYHSKGVKPAVWEAAREGLLDYGVSLDKKDGEEIIALISTYLSKSTKPANWPEARERLMDYGLLESVQT